MAEGKKEVCDFPIRKKGGGGVSRKLSLGEGRVLWCDWEGGTNIKIQKESRRQRGRSRITSSERGSLIRGGLKTCKSNGGGGNRHG